MTLLELFSDKSKWCQGHYGLDEKGEPIVNMDNACKFCLKGGMIKVAPTYNIRVVIAGSLQKSIRQLFPERLHTDDYMCPIARFNDHPDTTFEDVLTVIKDAGV